MLSWMGAAGILILCLWHSIVLLQREFQIRRTLSRLYSTIAGLVQARQQMSAEWLWIPGMTKRREQSTGSASTRRDLDDLDTLDRRFRAEPTMLTCWLSYRKTLKVEQPAWFLEPTVHSQRTAADFFSLEMLCASYLNVRFYRQLPTLMTSLGLLFTFLAILVGLSKLHANGSQIEGIQGLINGLAGKFITSVIGLACASLFTLLEGSVWHRLDNQHRACIALLDELFPQKVTDLSAQPASPTNGIPATTVGSLKSESANQLLEAVQQRLGATVAALTSASQSLASLDSSHSLFKREELAKDIGREVQRALEPIGDSLLEVLHALHRMIEERRTPVQLSHAEVEILLRSLKSHQGVNAQPGDSHRAIETDGARKRG